MILAAACENIESGDSLEKETVHLIKSLHLLDENERIIKFYSNFKKHKAGNFYTNKRIAHYWLDDYDKQKNDTSFAFYTDIVSIDTIYEIGAPAAPYMTIKKSDSTQFNVYVGDKKEIKIFYEEAIGLWKMSRR